MRRFDRLVCGIVAVMWLIAGSRSGLIASDEPTKADPNVRLRSSRSMSDPGIAFLRVHRGEIAEDEMEVHKGW